MLYICANTKGGVGKTQTATTLATILFYRGHQFRVIELDNSNISMLFSNSRILGDEKAISLKLDEKSKAIGSMIFQIANNKEMDYILDIGGGDDIKALIESLKNLKLEKTWLIPLNSDRKYLNNASETFEMINDPKNTFFILNRVYGKEALEIEFMYFLGNSKFGIKPWSENFAKSKYLTVPHSNFFQIAEDAFQTLLDLALISIEKNEEEITAEFLKIAAGDESKFIQLWTQYEQSQVAARIFFEIEKSFKKLLN